MQSSLSSCADGTNDENDAIWTLEFDLDPFNRAIPRMSRPSSIGEGVKFLNRLLSGRMFGTRLGSKPFYPVYGFLEQMRHNGSNVMVNSRIVDPASLNKALVLAEKKLHRFSPEVPVPRHMCCGRACGALDIHMRMPLCRNFCARCADVCMAMSVGCLVDLCGCMKQLTRTMHS